MLASVSARFIHTREKNWEAIVVRISIPKMNMRQQRITTSQQEVYLIYLMDHTDFAAAKIKDCESPFLSFSSPSHTIPECLDGWDHIHPYMCIETYWTSDCDFDIFLFLNYHSFPSRSHLSTCLWCAHLYVHRCACIGTHIRWSKVRRKLEGAHQAAQQHTRSEEDGRRVEDGMLCMHTCAARMNIYILTPQTFSPFLSGQVFSNWKGQLRIRAKKLKQIQDGKTGVDDKLALQKLTDVEKRALKLWKEDFQDKDIASVSECIGCIGTIIIVRIKSSCWYQFYKDALNLPSCH